MNRSQTDIEKSLARAVATETPDVLPGVLQQIQAQQDNTPMADTLPAIPFPQGAPPAKRRGRTLRWVVSVAAMLVLLVGLYGGFSYYNGLDSVISFDVNPSVELQVTRAEKVLSAAAMNPEADEILDGMNLVGVDLDVAVNALVGSMLKHGYLSASKNTILISVENRNTQKGAALQEKLAKEVGSILDSTTVSGAVLSQTLSDDEQLRALAEEYGISLGKAALVQLLVAQNPQLDFAGIAALPVNDIYLLIASKQTELGGVAANGQASTSAYIGVEQAKAVAMVMAGVSEGSLLYIEAELDYEDGRMVYDVEFAAGNTEYEFEIDALNGSVLKQETEPRDGQAQPGGTAPPTQDPAAAPDAQQPHSTPPPQSEAGAGYIGEAAAKAIALQQAGAAEDALREYHIKLDEEDGRPVYKLEFVYGSTEYECEIDALSGAILDWDTDTDDPDDYDGTDGNNTPDDDDNPDDDWDDDNGDDDDDDDEDDD